MQTSDESHTVLVKSVFERDPPECLWVRVLLSLPENTRNTDLLQLCSRRTPFFSIAVQKDMPVYQAYLTQAVI